MRGFYFVVFSVGLLVVIIVSGDIKSTERIVTLKNEFREASIRCHSRQPIDTRDLECERESFLLRNINALFDWQASPIWEKLLNFGVPYQMVK